MKRIPTGFTTEATALAVGGVGIPTTGAPFACAFGFDFNYLKAIVFSLIAKELLKLVERPAVQVCTLLLAKVLAVVANAIQLLYRYCGIPRFACELDYSLADHVVGVLREPCPSTGQPFEHTSYASGSALCLLPLEAGTGLGVPLSDMLQAASTVKLGLPAVCSNSDVVDPTINTDHGIVGLFDPWYATFERNRKEGFFLAGKESCISELPGREIFNQLGCAMKRDRLGTPVNGSYAQALLGEGEISATFPALQGNGALAKPNRFFQLLLGRSSCRILAGDMPNSTLSHLSGESEPLAHLRVGQLMQFNSVRETGVVESDFAGIVAGVSPGLDGALSYIKR
jgi:hypothetical protein